MGIFIDDAFQHLNETNANSVVKYLYDHKNKYDITDDDIQSSVAEFFTGGVETVSTTMHFSLAKLGSHPEFLDELYVEIKQNVESGQLIDEDVLLKSKFVKAFFKEVFRSEYLKSGLWLIIQHILSIFVLMIQDIIQ